jgi:hypothetical protein
MRAEVQAENEVEKLRVQKQLDFLRDAAEAKLELFKTELRDMFSGRGASLGDAEIIGDKAIAYYEQYRVNVREGADEAIGDIIDTFFSGGRQGVTEGFKKLIKMGIQDILGNTSGGEQLSGQFFIIPYGGSILRVDVKFWRYNFDIKNIITNVENAFCFVFCESVVDHTKVSKDVLLALATKVVGEDLTKIREYIQELEDLWDSLQTKTPADALEKAKVIVARKVPKVM